jgi:hypothetical protein
VCELEIREMYVFRGAEEGRGETGRGRRGERGSGAGDTEGRQGRGYTPVVPPDVTSTTRRPAAACWAMKSRARATWASRARGGGFAEKYWYSARAAGLWAGGAEDAALDCMLQVESPLERTDSTGEAGWTAVLGPRLKASVRPEGREEVWDAIVGC